MSADSHPDNWPKMKVNRDTNDPDLSDLAGALKEQSARKTALDLWNTLMEEVFIAHAYMKMTKSRVAPVPVYYERLMKAREALKHFEVTKHRVIVDAIITAMQALEAEHNSTHFLRLAKRMKIRSRIEATKATLLIVVNTAPPEGAAVARPKESPAVKKTKK